MLPLQRLLLSAIGSLVLYAVAFAQSPTLPPAAPPESGDTLSATRVPEPPAAPAAPSPEVRDLRRDLEQLIGDPGWNDARYGVLVFSLDQGDTLFALNPDLPLAPASNLKLFTTAAALYYLGPEFRYSTYLLGDGEVRDGVLDGDLVLFGTGDPSISKRMLESTLGSLRALADSLAAQGIQEVRGDLVGDGSYFDDAWIGEGWEEDDRTAWYAAPVGALSFAENMVSVRVSPGAAGAAARVRTTPETHGLAIDNQVRTVSEGATRVEFEYAPDRLVITGRISRKHPGLARSLPVVDPGNYVAAAFRAVLEERGIRVHGEVRSVRTPDASPVTLAAQTPLRDGDAAPRVLAVHLSPPLKDLLRITNQISHNLFADALLKTAGRVALGDGSFSGGARAVRYFLECETAADPKALHMVDGSGLSDLNRVSARATGQLLGYMSRSELWEVFHASLPEAATPNDLRHSLRRRMERTEAAGNLRAKTGTISNVSALSGYVRSANGERLAFVIIANDVPSAWRAKRTEDAIGERLARFTRPSAPAVVAGS